MYKISKEFHFEAAHKLNGLSPNHPCGRLHGHSYTVIIELKGEVLNPQSFVRDYGELAPIKEWIDKNLDHRYLNDIMGQLQPSAENIAKFLFDTFEDRYPELSAVTVKETVKTESRYEKT